ncbi:MAG: hypothetical protein ACXAC5_01145 [Promethearchaeota archaeon]|jgi:hypothetical protein
MNLRFKLSEDFPWSVFGAAPQEAKDPKSLNSRFYDISHLAPHEQLRIRWGQYYGIKKYLGDRTIEVKYRASWFLNWKMAGRVSILPFEEPYWWETCFLQQVANNSKQIADNLRKLVTAMSYKVKTKWQKK